MCKSCGMRYIIDISKWALLKQTICTVLGFNAKRIKVTGGIPIRDIS